MKDPAVLLYTDDFIAGTITMTDTQVGRYIKLLCLQHQKGRLSEFELNLIAKKDKTVLSKFIKDDNGYYNERMEFEALKRKAYTESRRANRNKADNENLFIYLMYDRNSGYYKIGSSVSPERRLIELKTRFPALILEKQYGRTKQYHESELHKMFEEKRIFNEFYNLNNDDLLLIESYMSKHITKHMFNHMGNGNVIVNRNEVIKKNDYKIALREAEEKIKTEGKYSGEDKEVRNLQTLRGN